MITKPSNGLAASGHSEGTDHDVEDLLRPDRGRFFAGRHGRSGRGINARDRRRRHGRQRDAAAHAGTAAGRGFDVDAATDQPGRGGSARCAHADGNADAVVPLPGVTSASPTPEFELSSEDRSQPDLADDDDDDEITVMARPSVTDDEEEATKVEPAETAIRAAASKDEDEDDELTAACRRRPASSASVRCASRFHPRWTSRCRRTATALASRLRRTPSSPTRRRRMTTPSR